MMPTIEIDNDVFARLQDRARAFVDQPNDVIRRLLDAVEDAGSATRSVHVESRPIESAPRTVNITSHRVGRLHSLIEKGLVRPGDKVRHVRKRTNTICEATITDGGCLKIDGVGELFREPSPALRHFTGSQIDGWNNFTHEPSGRTLRDLRDNG